MKGNKDGANEVKYVVGNTKKDESKNSESAHSNPMLISIYLDFIEEDENSYSKLTAKEILEEVKEAEDKDQTVEMSRTSQTSSPGPKRIKN